MWGIGSYAHTGWTRENSDDVFLALDRNGNGIVDDSRELFGDKTLQPPTSTPNGFNALGVFDQPEKGGNSDGLISSADAIWPSLFVWRDSNKDGVSTSSEHFSLSSQGIVAINLAAEQQPSVDEFGNRLKYKSIVQTNSGDTAAWDVFFKVETRELNGPIHQPPSGKVTKNPPPPICP